MKKFLVGAVATAALLGAGCRFRRHQRGCWRCKYGNTDFDGDDFDGYGIERRLQPRLQQRLVVPV